MGLPRPRTLFRIPARPNVARAVLPDGDLRSPSLVDYPYGLVLDRGYLKVWVGDGLPLTARETIADLLEEEVERLRAEATRGAFRGTSSLLRRTGREDARDAG